jgi:hypothetical protein
MAVIRSYVLEPRDLEPFIREARNLLADGQDFESVLRHLRESGCDLSDSISVTMSVTGKIHRDAKMAVCYSETWRDWFPAIVSLHDSLERALVQLAEEEPELVSFRSGPSEESSR